MSKVAEFLNKAAEDEAVKAELVAVLSDGKAGKSGDEQLEKIAEIAKKYGYEFSVEEAKAYLNGNAENGELDDDDLEKVAGGFNWEDFDAEVFLKWMKEHKDEINNIGKELSDSMKN
jgi:hypothetical protein